jgi:hypothetical protein
MPQRSPRRAILITTFAALFVQAAMKTGPEIGQPIPGFSLHDQDGRVFNLKTIAGPKGTMLVFYRSADW